MSTPNRIVLKSRGRYDEVVSSGVLYAGMLVLENSSSLTIAHNVAGGAAAPVVVQEDALQGKTILNPLVSGEITPVRRAAKGDQLLMLLQAVQNVAKAAELMSAGDGTLMANPGRYPVNIVAPSATLTNLAAETVFSNGTYTIPANFLKAGDVIRIHTKAVDIAQNSTNTETIKIYQGGTALANSGALALAAGQYSIIDLDWTIRTIGASGTYVAEGYMSANPAASITDSSFTVASTAIDTTAAIAITVKATQSAQSAGNQIALDEFRIEIIRAGGLNTIATADEAIDNSGSTGTSVNSAAFIRVLIR